MESLDSTMGDIRVFGALILDIGVFGTALLVSMDAQRHFFRQTELDSGDLVGITVGVGYPQRWRYAPPCPSGRRLFCSTI